MISYQSKLKVRSIGCRTRSDSAPSEAAYKPGTQFKTYSNRFASIIFERLKALRDSN